MNDIETKASELYWEYYQLVADGYYPEDTAKQCALICVDREIELIKKMIDESVNIHQSLSIPKKLYIDILNPILKELLQVKQEIQKQ
jgi:hypothetical protein